TSKKDKLALDRIMDMDPQGLYNTVIDKKISMCGMIPATIALKTAILLGATRSNLVEYTDSGAISGDTDQVVGYAGVTIT
ncbi:MAG: AmmeMemoRadiSam system protein B, partial [Desulfobulbaceae bacterium]|nr:AmmeMemoRadiSam system protein B [Desulfobulbaceae bacterium]